MNRIAWIDNLRVMTIILVVILHTGVTYSGIGGWYYIENHEVDLFSRIFFAFFQTFTQAYFMSLLFMVSGYFTRHSLEKKGPGRFLAGRLKRLGIPLLVYIFIVHALAVKLAYPDLDLASWYARGIRDLSFLSWTGPLWFVEALLIFTIVYVAVYLAFRKCRFSLKFRFTLPVVAILILVITLLAFTLRLVYPIGTDFSNLQFGFFSAYIVMFITGILAHTSGLFESISLQEGKRWLLVSLGVGIPAWILVIYFSGAIEGDQQLMGGMNWSAFFYALWESFFCVTFIIALTGLFRHKVNRGGKFQQFLSDQAFGVFVFHAPVLIGITVLLKAWHAWPVLKFFAVFPVAVTAAFALSWLIRRVKPFRKVFS